MFFVRILQDITYLVHIYRVKYCSEEKNISFLSGFRRKNIMDGKLNVVVADDN